MFLPICYCYISRITSDSLVNDNLHHAHILVPLLVVCCIHWTKERREKGQRKRVKRERERERGVKVRGEREEIIFIPPFLFSKKKLVSFLQEIVLEKDCGLKPIQESPQQNNTVRKLSQEA